MKTLLKSVATIVVACAVFCLAAAIPTHKLLADPVACLIDSVSLDDTTGAVENLLSESNCEASYPKACAQGATELNKNCKIACAQYKKYTGGEPTTEGPECKATLPVKTQIKQFNVRRDCKAIPAKPPVEPRWTVSCTVSSLSCICDP